MSPRRLAAYTTLGLLTAALATCSFDTRSGDFQCEVQADCTGGRVCEDGLCVLTTRIDGGTAVDADPSAPDGAPQPDASDVQCPAECTRCEGPVCVIECLTADACGQTVVCPPGFDCSVDCGGTASCAGGVDCTAAVSCDITCSNAGACASSIDCGVGDCQVVCSGTGSCSGGIDCDTSCACDTTCSGTGSCDTAPLCPGPGTCTAGDGDCRSGPGPCNTCM